MSSLKILTITAVLIVGDTVYRRKLNTHHLHAAFWNLFPHRNAGDMAFKAWERKKNENRSTIRYTWNASTVK